MKINATFDASAAYASTGFQTAVAAAVKFFETSFTDNITLNITFKYASLGSGLAQSQTSGYYQSYTTVKNALVQSSSSSDDLRAANTLTGSDPLAAYGGNYFVSYAEEKALGLLSANSTAQDGVVTLNSSSAWNYDPNNRAVTGKYDAVGALEHEISEVMGRSLGSEGSLTALALFRYSSSGVRDTSSSYSGAYFSVDGKTLLNQMGEQGSDLADWGSSISGDAFGYGATGKAGIVSETDLRVLDVMGYKRFDALDYIASYGDLIKAFGVNASAATAQWQANGYGEGRSVSFDGLDYIASYADLIKALGVNEDAGATHYIANGAKEGRRTTFNGLDYIASYGDLIGALGANEEAGAAHFIANGMN